MQEYSICDTIVIYNHSIAVKFVAKGVETHKRGRYSAQN